MKLRNLLKRLWACLGLIQNFNGLSRFWSVTSVLYWVSTYEKEKVLSLFFLKSLLLALSYLRITMGFSPPSAKPVWRNRPFRLFYWDGPFRTVPYCVRRRQYIYTAYVGRQYKNLIFASCFLAAQFSKKFENFLGTLRRNGYSWDSVVIFDTRFLGLACVGGLPSLF